MNGVAQQTIVFQEGVAGYQGTSDSFFLTGDPVRLVGDASEWEWDGEDAGGYNVGVLHFADIIGTNPGQIPPDATVQRAFLTLTITNDGDATQIATVHNLLKPFSEEEDFIDFTENFEPIAGDDYAEEVLAEIPGPSAGDVIEIDVTSSILAWLSGMDNYGWMFVPGGTNGVGVQASEAGGAPTIPTLVVNTPNGTFTFQDGRDGYDGTVDTWLNTGAGAADVNGENDWFEWDGDDNGGSNFGLLRFDNIFGTGAGQIPPGTTIDSAQVMITIQDEGSLAEVHDILPGSADEPTFFDDSNTTLLDFGDTFEPRAGIDYAEDVVATIDGNIGNAEIDVTSSLQNYSSGEANLGWIMVPTGGGGVEAISSEGTASGEGGPPKLTVILEGGSFVQDYQLH